MKNQVILIFTTLVLIGLIVGGYIVADKGYELFKGLDLLIFVLIVIFGVIAIYLAFKKFREKKAGLTIEDELSMQLKYKAGYYAFISSMYMWLFIFLLKDKFPDTESMLGGGILLSALIAFISKIIVKRELNEKPN